MRVVPERITRAWIVTLADDDLVAVEARLHGRLAILEKREKKLRGAKYELMRSPADVMDAWDRWSRVNRATQERSLKLRRERAAP